MPIGTNSGSLVGDRQSIDILAVLLVIIGIIAIIAAVFFISTSINRYLNSPAFLEKKKKRPTSLKNVNQISSECKLTQDEKNELWRICKIHRTPNILYLVHDTDQVEKILKEEFSVYTDAENEKAKSVLFSLRRKLMKMYRQILIVKNSKAIAPETVFTFTATQGFHHKLTLKENSNEGLVLTLPDTLKDSTDKPNALDKIDLIFESSDGTPYTMETRTVRYQKGKNGEEQLIAVHTDKISPLKKREQERAEVEIPVKFSSVKVSTDGKGKKEKTIYSPSEKEHDGTLEDISTGGCRIVTNLPIKKDQYIFVKGPLNGKQTDTAVGLIVRTTKRCDGVYIIHIKFVEIALEVVNRIQAMVIKYDI